MAKDALHEDRISAVRALYDRMPLLITRHEHIFYLTGFYGTAGRLLLTADEAFLFIDARYYEYAAASFPSVTPVLVAGDYEGTIAKFLAAKGSRALYLDKGLSVSEYELCIAAAGQNSIAVTLVDDRVKMAREVKDKTERTLMKDNLLRAETAFTKMLALVREGMTEKELAAELDHLMRLEGADAPSFETIVLFGARSSMPHGMPNDTKLSHGDIVLVDFGMRREGYCTDTTRTCFFGKGKNFTKLSRIYAAVEEAQKAGIAAAATGARAVDVDRAARSLLAGEKLDKYFGHGLGHGVGVEIHEAPTVSERGGIAVLKGGSVVTIEPGVYIPGVGGVRIENMVIVTKDGGASLNTIPTDMVVL